MEQSSHPAALSSSATAPRPVRSDGFTPQKRVRFLHALALCGNVSQACNEVGVSHQTVYLTRRRDAAFAQGWKAALALAFDVAEQDLADRALQGVEEKVWFRGEVVGYRTRFDARLFLAHFARLEQAAADPAAQDLAARFDETLACIAGEKFIEGMEAEQGRLLPIARQCFAALYEEEEQAAAVWDEWQSRAIGAVDAAIADDAGMEFKSADLSGQFFPRTASLSSTCSDRKRIL